MSTPTGRILVVEDEDLVRNMITDVLRAAGYEVRGAKEGREGLRELKASPPDLVVLDLNLPGMNGLAVCREIRADEQARHVGILVLTGNRGDEVETALFDAGADEYIRKGDFKPALFLRRVGAVLRRAVRTGEERLSEGPLALYPKRREAELDGRPLDLTPTEFDILYKLVTQRDRAVSRRELLDRGDDESGLDRTVDVHVMGIRRKLEPHGWLVATVRGVGYRLGSRAD